MGMLKSGPRKIGTRNKPKREPALKRRGFGAVFLVGQIHKIDGHFYEAAQVNQNHMMLRLLPDPGVHVGDGLGEVDVECGSVLMLKKKSFTIAGASRRDGFITLTLDPESRIDAKGRHYALNGQRF